MTKFEKVINAGSELALEHPEWLLIQLAEGVAYVRRGDFNEELITGATIIIPPNSRVRVRASQLGNAVIRGLQLRIGAFSGILTVAEYQSLISEGAQRCKPFLFAPASHPIGASVLAILKGDRGVDPLHRLDFFHAFLDLALPKKTEENTKQDTIPADAQARFRQLLERTPQAEMVDLTLSDVAAFLHCCDRHASRLFHEVCGCSYRDYLTELRMNKACFLLAEGKLKIIEVAMESGFQSQTLFNYAFKRRFGMTPSQWRDRRATVKIQHRRMPTLLAMMAMLFICLGAAFQNANAVPATTNSPPASTNAPVRQFAVKNYMVEGNSILPTMSIDKLMSKYTGDHVSLETVKEALGALQMEYRNRGYLTVKVTLPPQTLTNDIIKVVVVEGIVTEIKVVNNHYFSSNNIIGALPSLQHFSTNRLFNSKLLQAELDRANSNPDRQIYATVRAGPDPGTSALFLETKDRQPLHGKVEANDYASPSTPNLRLNSVLTYNNLWQEEHTIGLQYGFTPDKKKDALDVSHMYMTDLDRPLVSYYSAFYRAPLGEPDSAESQLARDQTHFGYNETTHQFVLPPLTGRPELIVYGTRSTTSDREPTIGDRTPVYSSDMLTISNQSIYRDYSDDVDAGLKYIVPFQSVGNFRSSFSFGLDYKVHLANKQATNIVYTHSIITNVVNGVTNIITTNKVIDIDTSRLPEVSYLPFYLGWNGSLTDKQGKTDIGLSIVKDFRTGLSSGDDFQTLVGSDKADASFVIYRGQISRLQRLWKDWMLFGNIQGQAVTAPLVSVEQMSLGGVYSVRGYKEGEYYGDKGWFAQGELRTPTYWMGHLAGEHAVGVSAVGFTDYGRVYTLTDTPSSHGLWGSGAGVNLNITSYLEAHMSVAWPLLEGAYSEKGHPRFNFSVSAQF